MSAFNAPQRAAGTVGGSRAAALPRRYDRSVGCSRMVTLEGGVLSAGTLVSLEKVAGVWFRFHVVAMHRTAYWTSTSLL